MTPQEKAKYLVDKYRNELSWIERDYKVDLWRDAMQCALICVDEIIELPVCWYSKELADKNDEECPHSATEEYWLQVKEEINRLS